MTPTPTGPVSTDSTAAYQRLADRIRAQILSGTLRPGDRLATDAELSARYGTGQSTAREAIRILASQGLVRTRRGVHGGNFVAHPTPDQLSASLETGLGLLAAGSRISTSMLLEVRELLEVPATSLAATRRTREELARIRDSLRPNDTEQDDDADATYRRSQRFHAEVLAAAGNPLLSVVAGPVFGVLDDGLLRALAPTPFWRRVASDHRDIYTHIAAKDPDAVAEAARRHIRYLRRAYTRAIPAADDPPAGRSAAR